MPAAGVFADRGILVTGTDPDGAMLDVLRWTRIADLLEPGGPLAPFGGAGQLASPSSSAVPELAVPRGA